MVLVISRFKVANGLEEAVADAFYERPRLVDNVPGFLGMETYTHHSDPSIFHLITRWTDREAFHAWHKSPQHRLSHTLLPQGLKLDSSVTEILELTRLPHETHRVQLQDYLLESLLLLDDFLAQANTIIFCVIDAQGYIQVCNEALNALLRTSGPDWETRPFWECLTEPDRQRLQELQRHGCSGSRQHVRLNVVDTDQVPHTLDGVVQSLPSQTLILVGEEPQGVKRNAVEELAHIHNDMVVMMREEMKSGKSLAKAKQELDQVVAERTKALVHHQELLRAALVEMTLVEQRERGKLANELHDHLAQLLIACRMKLAHIDKPTVHPDRARLLHEVDQMLDQSLAFTRTLISDLHPTMLRQQGLLPALAWLAEDMARFGLTVSKPEVIPPLTVSEEIGVLGYKTVRELLFNVLKHADVTEAVLRWDCSEQHLRIHVEDFGQGFDPEAKHHQPEPGHLGLFFYRERIEAVNGQFCIRSRPGAGTHISITLPLAFSSSSS